MRNRIVDLIEQAAVENLNTVFITGDLGYSVVERIRDCLGERFINAGVSEANMATMAGAMAMAGYRVYIYSITPFVTLRCLEQIRNDICYQGRNVHIVGVGAGFSYGSLGPSHHALEDASVMASLPGMTVLCPAGIGELDALFSAYANVNEPVYFRIGRETGPKLSPPALPCGYGAWVVREGCDATVVCSGAVLGKVLDAADSLAKDNISLHVVSVPQMHPFPVELVAGLIRGPIISVVEAYPGNPFEVGVMRVALASPEKKKFRALNVNQDFPKLVGSHDTLRDAGGISTAAIMDAVRLCGTA